MHRTRATEDAGECSRGPPGLLVVGAVAALGGGQAPALRGDGTALHAVRGDDVQLDLRPCLLQLPSGNWRRAAVMSPLDNHAGNAAYSHHHYCRTERPLHVQRHRGTTGQPELERVYLSRLSGADYQHFETGWKLAWFHQHLQQHGLAWPVDLAFNWHVHGAG